VEKRTIKKKESPWRRWEPRKKKPHQRGGHWKPGERLIGARGETRQDGSRKAELGKTFSSGNLAERAKKAVLWKSYTCKKKKRKKIREAGVEKKVAGQKGNPCKGFVPQGGKGSGEGGIDPANVIAGGGEFSIAQKERRERGG